MTTEDRSADVREERAARLRELLAGEELEALLVSHPPNLRYLSGFTGSTGYLFVAPDELVLVVDGRYDEQAEAEAAGAVAEVVVARDGLLAALGQVVTARPDLRTGFEAAHVSVAQRAALEQEAGDVAWSPLDGSVERLRARKDPEEVERIARAARIASDVWEPFARAIEEGDTERELAGELEHRLRRAGSDDRPFASIVASGERSALPHARPSDRAVREGDLVLADFGATFEGYVSDLTRCAVLGAADPWQREVHAAVEAARAAAVEAVEAGADVSDVDAAARDRLDEAGFAEHFDHSTGHGIGLEVHEDPSLSSRSDAILRPGNVVTIEPGVYLRGRGGVRLEDDVVVEASGTRVLTTAGRALREL